MNSLSSILEYFNINPFGYYILEDSITGREIQLLREAGLQVEESMTFAFAYKKAVLKTQYHGVCYNCQYHILGNDCDVYYFDHYCKHCKSELDVKLEYLLQYTDEHKNTCFTIVKKI